MDISDINRVASRKRINEDVVKLREKVSRETAKIIKLKVAQDTAYWELKEKLQQVEGNHERLQQNMVEVQMQHETLSGQYQDELRLRPETLNKVNSTREICDVLENYSERLKETLSRCKADQAALCDAYTRSGTLVREMKTKQAQLNERNRHLIDNLEEKLKISNEHQSQLNQVFMASKQQSDVQLADLKTSLAETARQKDELFTAVNDLDRKLTQCTFDIKKKDETISRLQTDIKQLIHEANAQTNDLKMELEKRSKELKEKSETNVSLVTALGNQEAFTKSVCDEKAQLQEKVCSLEEEQLVLVNSNQELQIKLQEATVSRENLKSEIERLTQIEVTLNADVQNKTELLTKTQSELQSLEAQLTSLEGANALLKTEVDNFSEENKVTTARIEEMLLINQNLERNAEQLSTDFANHREASETTIKEMTVTIEVKDKELDSKASTINQLMAEVKGGTDARAKLEATLQRVRKEMETLRDASCQREMDLVKQVEQLKNVIKDKEDELSKNMKIILDLRNEKEQLQERVQNLRGTIENVQKELDGRTTRDQPEQDDNAVMLTPASKKPKRAPSPILPCSAGFVAPRAPHNNPDSMVFNFLSDSSNDTLDVGEVNRRFEALSRGEHPSPLPLKQRGGVATHSTQRAFNIKSVNMLANAPDVALSLSQVRNEIKSKDRAFFKNRRIDNKVKKAKN